MNTNTVEVSGEGNPGILPRPSIFCSVGPENEERESIVGLRRETKAKNTEGDLTRSL